MKRQWQAVWLVTFWMTLTLSYGPVGAAAPADASKPRPMELADVLAWKSINPAVVSNDGRWFAYRLVPAVGDSEVVVRQTQTEKAYRFPVGSSSGQATLAFSDNSAWLAFSVAPTAKELAQLKKQKKPAQTSVRLLNLATGLDMRVDKVRRVAFSGEQSTWVALQKYGPDAAAGDAPKGADLILRELSTGAELNVGNVSEFAFDKSGRWLAWIIDAQDQTGNGVELRNMDTGQVRPLDTATASYARLTWTDKGDAFAVLRGTDDKRYTDKLYTVVAIRSLRSATPQKTTYDPAGDKAFPEGMSISPNDSPTWTDDLSGLLFGIRTLKTAPAKPGEKPDATTDGDAQKPDLVIWHHLDARLPTEQQVQEQADKNFS
ncbi:MAG: S9 family peptidase, partial [Chloroflexi bacterium]|nr:S9 family peptidase [Chloroflexota bacterium]